VPQVETEVAGRTLIVTTTRDLQSTISRFISLLEVAWDRGDSDNASVTQGRREPVGEPGDAGATVIPDSAPRPTGVPDDRRRLREELTLLRRNRQIQHRRISQLSSEGAELREKVRSSQDSYRRLKDAYDRLSKKSTDLESALTSDDKKAELVELRRYKKESEEGQRLLEETNVSLRGENVKLSEELQQARTEVLAAQELAEASRQAVELAESDKESREERQKWSNQEAAAGPAFGWIVLGVGMFFLAGWISSVVIRVWRRQKTLIRKHSELRSTKMRVSSRLSSNVSAGSVTADDEILESPTLDAPAWDEETAEEGEEDEDSVGIERIMDRVFDEPDRDPRTPPRVPGRGGH